MQSSLSGNKVRVRGRMASYEQADKDIIFRKTYRDSFRAVSTDERTN